LKSSRKYFVTFAFTNLTRTSKSKTVDKRFERRKSQVFYQWIWSKNCQQKRPPARLKQKGSGGGMDEGKMTFSSIGNIEYFIWKFVSIC